jgi:glycosyltransferase involved in cell wall biosynthesis
VLPEAASCGLPVVASDIPEIRSLCPGNAWLLNPVDDVGAFAEGLREMARQIVVYKNLAAAVASGFRERFSMETCARRYIETYKDAMEGVTP